MEQISHIDFHPVTVADKPLFDSYMMRSEVQNCDLCFANIFAWSDTYHSEIAHIKDFILIRFTISNNDKAYMMPIGNGDTKEIIELIKRDAFAHHSPLRIVGIDSKRRDIIEQLYPNEFAFTAQRALNDYIYLTAELAQLRGRRFQPKRNHINQFVARNDWYTKPLSRENIEDCLLLNKRWLSARTITEIEVAEQRAMQRALDNFEALGLRGLVLYSNDQPVAFTYGTAINADTFCTHIEKHDIEYDGAAVMINKLMAQTLEGEFKYINREDDLGLEGLRFAKMSYHPTTLLEKITALHLTPEQQEMRTLWHDVFGDELTEIDSFLINYHALPLIHKEEGRVVSMLHLVPLHAKGVEIAYIYAVATHPEYRGRGISSGLLNQALSLAEKSGRFDMITLIPSSSDSKRLYARLGFEDTQTPMLFPANEYLGTGSVAHDLAMVRLTSRGREKKYPPTLEIDG